MALRDRLALSADERELQSTLRGFLAERQPSAALRAAADSDAGFDTRLHDRLVRELGLGGLTVPEEYGGLGMTALEASVVHAELGRVLYPGPFLATCVAVAGLVAAGEEAACRRWLPPVAAGSATGTFAMASRDGTWPEAGDVRASEGPDGWQLTGELWYVLSARAAGFCVVPALAGDDSAVFVVALPASGALVAPMAGLDLTRQVSSLRLDRAAGSMIASGERTGLVLDRITTEFLLATAAEAAGGVGWCLDTAASHAADRKQFGRAIGSFQAIAHQCADLLAAQQTAAASARYAAAATAEQAPDAVLATRVAALRAGEAYRAAAETTIHILGGIGFTWEHDAHLYYRRAWSAQQLAGGARAHRAAIAGLAGL